MTAISTPKATAIDRPGPIVVLPVEGGSFAGAVREMRAVLAPERMRPP